MISSKEYLAEGLLPFQILNFCCEKLLYTLYQKGNLSPWQKYAYNVLNSDAGQRLHVSESTSFYSLECWCCGGDYYFYRLYCFAHSLKIKVIASKLVCSCFTESSTFTNMPLGTICDSWFSDTQGACCRAFQQEENCSLRFGNFELD